MQLEQFRKRLTKLDELGRSLGRSYGLRKGGDLYVEGAYAGESYLVLEGRLRLITRIEMRYVTVGWAAKGDILGLEPVLQDSSKSLTQYPRQFTARATERTEVSSYTPSCPEVAEELHFEMLRSVVQAHMSVPSRLAQFILWWQEKYGNPIPYWFTHQEIGDLMGSTRETVTTLLSEFRRDRLINVEDHRIEVEDFGVLRKIAHASLEMELIG